MQGWDNAGVGQCRGGMVVILLHNGCHSFTPPELPHTPEMPPTIGIGAQTKLGVVARKQSEDIAPEPTRKTSQPPKPARKKPPPTKPATKRVRAQARLPVAPNPKPKP